ARAEARLRGRPDRLGTPGFFPSKGAEPNPPGFSRGWGFLPPAFRPAGGKAPRRRFLAAPRGRAGLPPPLPRAGEAGPADHAKRPGVPRLRSAPLRRAADADELRPAPELLPARDGGGRRLRSGAAAGARGRGP